MIRKTVKSFAALLIAAVVVAGPATQAFAKSNNKISAGNGQRVKNVIVMVADGWGYNQILATNYYNNGKAKSESYQKFPVDVAMSTYSVGSYDPLTIWNNFDSFKKQPTDSAAAGTAMSTGYKTYDAGIGVDMNEKTVAHIADAFEAMGRSTGVVSTVQFFHATPAAFSVHNINRNNYNQIAEEMIRDSALDVVMAPGHPGFNDNNQKMAAMNFGTLSSNRTAAPGNGEKLWNDLVSGKAGADSNNDGIADPWKFIETKEEFVNIMTGDAPDKVFGVPQVSTTLQQGRSGDSKADPYAVKMNENVPTLAEMSKAALNVLDNNKEGLFLIIEGGAIDWAGHANQSGRVIEEMSDFNEAVDAVIDWVNTNSNWGETLLIVTGDHETGYLTGKAGVYSAVENNGAGVLPVMAWNSSDHTNQLIPMFAKGQGSNLLKKAADQKDPVRGNYMDNTEFYSIIMDLLK